MPRCGTTLALLCVCVCACAQPQLHIAVSKRIPVEGDTVKLAAYLEGWQQPTTTGSVTFLVDHEGQLRPIGKSPMATNPADPFETSIEWSPAKNGLYTILASRHDAEQEARLRVPVVVQERYFCFYGRTRPELEWMTHHLTAGEPEVPALHARGVMALKHRGGVSYIAGPRPRPEDIKADVDFAELAPRVIKDYTEVDPWDGIAIDELGMWDDHPVHTQLALGFSQLLEQARAAAPDKFMATWQFGALTALECNMFRDSMDLIMCEVYQNYFRAWYDQHTFYEYLQQRIDMARKMDVIKKTIIGLSIAKVYGGITPEELEDQIRYIRAHGPEMPGLAFFTTSRCDNDVLKRADECCYRYWVKPAVGLFSRADLTLSDYQPENLGIVRVGATVHNVGGMDAQNVKVRFWDGDPANGGTPVGGDKVIPRLPAAKWVDPEARDGASWDPPEAVRRDGFGMVTVSVNWRARRGPHELWAEVLPDPQYTTVRAFQSKRVSVRGTPRRLPVDAQPSVDPNE